MPAVRYGTSRWIDRRGRGALPPARPRLRGEAETSVVIVGGGLAGCATAYVFAQAGVKTILVEAERLARRGTAGAPGVIGAGAGTGFRELRELHGLRVARHLWAMSRAASQDLCTLIRKLKIRCDFETADIVDAALTDDQAVRLEREHRALLEAGIDAAWVTGKRLRAMTGLEPLAAIVRPDAGLADPYPLAVALAALAERKGAAIHESTPVRKIKVGRAGVEVLTGAGVVRASTVVIATDQPAPDLKALHRHLRPVATTVAAVPELPVTIRRGLGAHGSIVRDVAEARHVWHVSAAGQLLAWQDGQPVPAARELESATVRRVNDLMYEFSVIHPHVSGVQPKFGWTGTSYAAHDGVVVAGPHRAFPRHLFAVGLGQDGLQAALLAARLNLRHYRGSPDKGDEVFGFLR